jgi:hypothetical protein
MKLIQHRLPSAMIVALLGAFLALGGVGVAATGGNFILGQANSADQSTSLSGTVGGTGQLRVENAATGSSSFGISGKMSSGSAASDSAGVRGVNASTNVASSGVWGLHQGSGIGVYGTSAFGRGVVGVGRGSGVSGTSTQTFGVYGSGYEGGLYGISSGGYGVTGITSTSIGVRGISTTSYGVAGHSSTGVGVRGSSAYRGVEGFSVQGLDLASGIGVIGNSLKRGVVGVLNSSSCAGTYAVGGCAGSTAGDGVLGRASSGTGVRASTSTGNIFIGEGAFGIRRVRISPSGRGYFNGGTQTGGADYAESTPATSPASLEPGDVVAIDPRHGRHGYAVRKSVRPSSRLVAGVYSTKPALLAVGRHGIDDSLAGEVPVAMLGVVPTKVSAENGAIRAGDLLTTSSTPGHAMKAKPIVVRGVAIYPTGAILGKALQPLPSGQGMIKVLVMLR